MPGYSPYNFQRFPLLPPNLHHGYVPPYATSLQQPVVPSPCPSYSEDNIFDILDASDTLFSDKNSADNSQVDVSFFTKRFTTFDTREQSLRCDTNLPTISIDPAPSITLTTEHITSIDILPNPTPSSLSSHSNDCNVEIDGSKTMLLPQESPKNYLP